MRPSAASTAATRCNRWLRLCGMSPRRSAADNNYIRATRRSATRVQCDARPTVTFRAAGRRHIRTTRWTSFSRCVRRSPRGALSTPPSTSTTAPCASTNRHVTTVPRPRPPSRDHRQTRPTSGGRRSPPALRQWFYTVTCRNDVMASRRPCPGCCLAVDHGRCVLDILRWQPEEMIKWCHSTCGARAITFLAE